MEKNLKEFAQTAASVLTERWQAIDSDRRSRIEPERLDESIEITVELTASDEQSETSARVVIFDSAE